ncbi:MAG: hypothetical protein ACI9FN_003316 [Saprospiraceae bacterium]|jgi:hypothetical protein
MNQSVTESIEAILKSTKDGMWIGRCYMPASLAYKGISGPHVLRIKNNDIYDLT